MKKIVTLFAFSTLIMAVKANNITVTNVSLTRNTTTHTGQITFTVAWENSWRTSIQLNLGRYAKRNYLIQVKTASVNSVEKVVLQ